MTINRLKTEVLTALAVKNALLDQFGDALAEDERALFDTLDGETDVFDALHAVLHSMENDEMMITGIKARVDDLSERKHRLETRAMFKRAAVLDVLIRLGVGKREYADMTISKSARKKLFIDDEGLLPRKFVRTRQEPDRKAIAAAIKAGQEVAGARYVDGDPTLTIRRK